MVTLAGTQNFSEFELHCRAVLGLPIPSITLERAAASSVILYYGNETSSPQYFGLEKALEDHNTDIRIFGKPITRTFRRMGVALAWNTPESDIQQLRNKAHSIANKITISH
jgi:phosphoribosylglycinamide formyltransferase 2